LKEFLNGFEFPVNWQAKEKIGDRKAQLMIAINQSLPPKHGCDKNYKKTSFDQKSTI